MNDRQVDISKLQQIPEPLVDQVNNFIDTLLQKHNSEPEQHSAFSAERVELVNSGCSDYLSNLEDYEERLSCGEIQW